MTVEIMKIAEFVINAFMDIWPYLLITIPIAVLVNMSGASKYIKKAFAKGPLIAIILATIVGAFSPFCSCTVIPVVASLLISGVPLAPVMSFWIASPSMDPEIFFLSVGTIGFNLAVWRLAATLVLSLLAGYITLYLEKTGWIGKDILRTKKTYSNFFSGIKGKLNGLFKRSDNLIPAFCCGESDTTVSRTAVFISDTIINEKISDNKKDCIECGEEETFSKRLFKESLDASVMVLKFMTLAFLIEALIIFYVPESWIKALLGSGNSFSIITSAVIGVPVYTSNLSALPMVSGLLAHGMNPGAALAFLIAGPTTTLPAMTAVWSLVRIRVFLLYVMYSLFGAIIIGYAKFFIG